MKALFTHSFLSLKLMSFGIVKITIFFKLELRHILQHLPMASCNTCFKQIFISEGSYYICLKQIFISVRNDCCWLLLEKAITDISTSSSATQELCLVFSRANIKKFEMDQTAS